MRNVWFWGKNLLWQGSEKRLTTFDFSVARRNSSRLRQARYPEQSRRLANNFSLPPICLISLVTVLLFGGQRLAQPRSLSGHTSYSFDNVGATVADQSAKAITATVQGAGVASRPGGNTASRQSCRAATSTSTSNFAPARYSDLGHHLGRLGQVRQRQASITPYSTPERTLETWDHSSRAASS